MNWVILLTRGRVAVHVLRSDWQLNGRKRRGHNIPPIPRRILAERMHTCVSHGFGDASGIPPFNLTLLI